MIPFLLGCMQISPQNAFIRDPNYHAYNLCSLAHHSTASVAEFFATSSRIKCYKLPNFTSIKWYLPDREWVKLNCEGSSIGNLGSAGAGAIILDSKGSQVAGCHRFLGSYSNMIAGLWAIRDGLQLA
ncbi:hypothetical protein PVK06_006356 [Gossypium arboreum]|uniref:RNase H type-1 domain-containing protein n=1 Tax=Gossypium arboreum TaxID=29729 RepID=A0ABR0QEH0_GOSAR|nr:hypothetical protein PVK06_006356 [Gossypium arboreum]